MRKSKPNKLGLDFTKLLNIKYCLNFHLLEKSSPRENMSYPMRQDTTCRSPENGLLFEICMIENFQLFRFDEENWDPIR